MRNFGMNDIYFFDTYAIIEIIKGNSNYDKFKNVRIVMAIFNLVELHYSILKDFNKEIADKILKKYADYVIGIDLEVIKDANEFRYKNKNLKLSYADCIGYIIAKQKSIKFLTGDKQFENIENIEFVK